VSFGTQTYGDETFGGGFSISSIAPTVASRVGGTKVVLTGSFSSDTTYLVKVDAVVAYSGVPGQGDLIQSDGATLSFVLPPLTLSQIGIVTVEVEESPGGDKVQTTMNVIEQCFGSARFEIRRMFPPWYETGPRRLELEPEEQ